MISISVYRFRDLIRHVKGMRFAIIGDIMLDRYLWGSVNRISPEAPVPIVDIESESSRLGGAANVANNIEALGATPFLIGVVGSDSPGQTIKQLMEEKRFPTDGLIIDDGRPSSVKTRVIAHNQHVVRVDRESREGISKTITERICSVIEKNIHNFNGVIVQDYNKGLLIPDVIHYLNEIARKNNTLITVDPKFHNFFEYQNVTVFKPNQRELELVLGKRFATDDEFFETGKDVRERLHCKNLLITRGEKGMALFELDSKITQIPTRAREIHDVSGAGDTVISTLTLFLACGATLLESAHLANYAAGVVCGEVGVVPITIEKLEEAIIRDSAKVHQIM